MARLLSCLAVTVLAWSQLQAGLSFLAGSTGRMQMQRRGQAPLVAMQAGKTAKHGVFSPIVEGAKVALGPDELTKLRGEAIKAHSAAINYLVETASSPFGKVTLRRLFDAADTDHSGKLDTHEVLACMHALGFAWIDEAKAAAIVKKGDMNDDNEIDFEEFILAAPKTLRQNLVKLAKQNGNSMGLLV